MDARDDDTGTEARIEALRAAMTLEEKAAFVAGSGMWHTTPIPRLGIARMKVSDGPIGVRGAQDGGRVTSACFPNASCLAASFDPSRVEAVGRALAEEAHSKGVHVVLGPTVNLHRSPLGGRHFECYSEDPELTARLCVAFVRGVQSAGVGTSVKHYVGNDSEFERHTISSEISERALREVYLRPFEAAVREAGAWTIMAAYNRVNGTFATEHRELLVDVLKDEWGFDGLVVSDWFAVKDGVAAASGGLDLEMPGPPRHFGAPLAQAVKDGRVPESEVDDKVRRILRVMARTGALDATEEPAERAEDRPEHRALARRAAADGMVLLRNEGGLLPLAAAGPARIRRLALVGPNAADTCLLGGGSARVFPHHEVTALDALRECAARHGFELVHEPGCTSHKRVPLLDAEAVDSGRGRPGFALDYFEGLEPAGEPVHSRVTRTTERTWLGRFHPDVDPDRFSARMRGVTTPAEGGRHVFSLTSAGRSRLFVDGALVVDAWTAPVAGEAWFGAGSREETGEAELVAGEPAEIVVEYSRAGGFGGHAGAIVGGMGGLRIGHVPPIPADLLERAEAAAREADVAVAVVGLNAEWESEGHDKDDMALPGRQAELVRRVAAANPRTVVVLNTGGPVEMDWAPEVPAILQAWYGGQEAGAALADVLLGEREPGGRLPTTFPRRLEDGPAHTDDPATYPGVDGRVVYAEDLLVGHRHYDARGRAPRFPFGHGLGYTTVALGPASVTAASIAAGEPAVLRVPLRNTGARSGREVVQVYLRALESRLPRPPKELAAFAKVELAPGEERTVEIEVPARAFAVWDPARHAFVTEPGAFDLVVARSAGDPGQAVRVAVTGARPA